MASDKSELMEVFESMLNGKVGSYILTSVVAMGSFGAVFCGEHEKTEMLAAIKCLFKKGLTPKQMEIQKTELTLNLQIGSHPHICSLLEPVETDEHLFLIFEFCENGDLFDLIRENRLPTADRAQQLFLQAIAGIEHCHTRGVFHRDLKPENLLLTMNKIKIADFGLATTEPYPRELGVGSPPYMGPELFDRTLDSYSAPKADIWALGVIFFNMLYKVNPWETAVPSDPHYAAHLKDPQGSLKKRFNLSDQLARIFTSVFEPNFTKRCSLKELRAMVLALDVPTSPAPKSQGFFSSWFSSSSTSSSSTTSSTASSASTPASSSSTSLLSNPSTTTPSPSPAISAPSALSKALASSSPASKPVAITTPSSSTTASNLSSSMASEASFKSALSSSFTHRGTTPTTPVSIRSSVPKNSSQETFSSSFASSWADDDGEMDFDAIPDLDDDRDSQSLNSDAYGSLDSSSQGSFVEDHATLHPASTSTASLTQATSSPQATPSLPPSYSKPRKHSPSSPKAGAGPNQPRRNAPRSDRSRAKGAVRHEESDRHSSDDERSSPSLKQYNHRRQNSDDPLFTFDEDWHNTLPTPGAQATPGGLKGSSPALSNRRASPANTPKVTSSQPVRRKSAAGLTSTFMPLPSPDSSSSTTTTTTSSSSSSSSTFSSNSAGGSHQSHFLRQGQQGQPTGSRTTMGFNTPQPRTTSSPSSSFQSSHSSSLPSRPHGGAHAPHKAADLSFIPSVNAELALNGIAHIYDRPRTIHALSSQ